MSFIKKIFTSKKKSPNETTDSTNPTQNTDDTIQNNERESLAIPASYKEITEESLRTEQISLFDGNRLLIEKFYELFKERIKEIEFTDFTDESRPNVANKNGGVDYHNKAATSQIRSIATDFVKQIGKKLLTGDFNMTNISFPIKVMAPKTFLQATALSFFQFPFYMHLAAKADPVEKMKYVIVAVFAAFHCSCHFLKPMNPILGETYKCCYDDGSLLYLEQTSHHPPVTNFEVYGPNRNYYMYGTTAYRTSVGLNLTLSVYNKGKRTICFPDGTKIAFDYCKVSFS